MKVAVVLRLSYGLKKLNQKNILVHVGYPVHFALCVCVCVCVRTRAVIDTGVHNRSQYNNGLSSYIYE